MAIVAKIDRRVLLIIGFIAISIGIFLSYSTPASGYEPSIYTGTPLLFWIFSFVAMSISLFITFYNDNHNFRSSSILLGGLTMFSIVALPIIRGYHYIGENDALTHLGHTRDLNNNVVGIEEIRYPAVHILGSVFSDLTTSSLNHSLLIILAIFILIFFVFISLSIKHMSKNTLIINIGVYSSFLLLPINHLGVSMQIHPTSQAIMFSPVLIYLFIRNYNDPRWELMILFSLVSAMFVILHPQQAANLIIFFTSIAIIQVLYQWSNSHLYEYSVITLVGVLVLAFWLWANNLAAFESSISSFVVSIMADSESGSQISSRGASLAELGGSLEGVFVRMFFVSLIYCGVGAYIMMAVTTKIFGLKQERLQFVLTGSDSSERMLLFYFTIGLIAVSVLFFAYLAGDMRSQYMRHYGFIMVVVTIMGAISLGRTIIYLNTLYDRDLFRKVTVLTATAFLILTTLVLFPSPYMYQTTGHVTEGQMDGFERAFEYEDDSYSYDHVRMSASRFSHAINGRDSNDRTDYYIDGVRLGGMPDHFSNQSLETYFDDRVYLTITRTDRVREPIIYNGFRFNHRDFEYLDDSPDINKVSSNGEFDLYIITHR
ncbi:hypothetical protein [Natronococcus pandeyae]|uniref:hypothetical protein n=1 Tax=Natronococcus pandeyae TaxID=2055836 RepID=UPI0011E73230|nr:hypothetical protein [Natronococcus pandeyae]